MYVDVHTHLTHEKFSHDRSEVIARAIAAGLGAIVVNGLEPQSNLEILTMATNHPVIKPALGIYPVDAVNHLLPEDYPLPVQRFSVNDEIASIKQAAAAGKIAAIGECGLDGHWLDATTYKAQEEVFEKLLAIAMDYDIPAIIHTRKMEQRCIEILAAHGARKINFHCFGGRTKIAVQAAEKYGWWFSIPANANVSESFRKMLSTLPIEKILTETDAPYLSPVKGERNEPANVVGTVAILAGLRGLTPHDTMLKVYQNFKDLFGDQWH